MGLKIVLKLVAFIMYISYFTGYKKTNKLETYIAYWGWVLIAILI